MFNNSQDRFQVEVQYKVQPLIKQENRKDQADIIIASWLRNERSRALYRPLDYLFDELVLSKSMFYQALLRTGNIDDKQYLLPVSFNVPAIIFSRENSARVENPFILELDVIRELSKQFNKQYKETYTRMGFSPRWDDEFLLTLAILYKTRFREGAPLFWNTDALQAAINYVTQWSTEINTSASDEDEYAFKYLYDPPEKLAISGRLLFSSLPSNELFRINADRLAQLDFRWVSRNQSIPLIEGAPWLAVTRAGKARSATEAFVKWFYSETTQNEILAYSFTSRMNETSFGIAGGFSSLKTVNESILPRYYPGLLGHVPPSDYLSPPDILPSSWMELKQKVILPWLRESAAGIAETTSMEQRLIEWRRESGFSTR
jgi:ABC-type glycerol-3-phosphate transport system substrate-binding protein